MEKIEDESTQDHRAPVRAGNVRSFADNARHHLAGAFDITVAASSAYEDARPDYRDLRVRLESGLPSAALPLLQLPVRLDRGGYLALYRNGLVNKSEVLDLDPSRLREIIGPIGARRIFEPRRGW